MSARKVIGEKERKTIEEKAWSEVERLRGSAQDWGVAASCWIKWIQKDSKSWDIFVDWLIDNEVPAEKIKESIYPTSNDFYCFAQDWVADEERQEYLALCGADTGTEKAVD